MAPVTHPLPPKLERIVQKFQQIAEPKQRYEYLLWFAKRVPEPPETEWTVENKVPGCVSQVFITADLEEGVVRFRGTSDAQITKGLVGLLIEGLNALPPDEILQLTPDFIHRTGLDVSLTPSRSNGFYNMLQFMKRKVTMLQLADFHSPSGDLS